LGGIKKMRPTRLGKVKASILKNNCGGEPVPMNKSTNNNTKPHPGTGAKKEAAWTWYGEGGKVK